jgi:anti-sigma factor RsiW
MSRVECSTEHPLINAYLDGELSVLEVAELQRHLAFCERCSAELEGLGRVRRALAEWRAAPVTVPVGFAARTAAVMAVEQERSTRSRLDRVLGQRLRGLDMALGEVSLPGGRSLRVRTVIGWGLAAAALLIGFERRHLRRARQLRPS